MYRRVINDLTRLGARVVSEGERKVRVRSCERRRLIYCPQHRPAQERHAHPRRVRHLVGNGQLAVKTGIDPPQNVVLAGTAAVDLKNGVARVCRMPASTCAWTAARSEDLRVSWSPPLGSEGFISIFAVVRHDSGMVLAGRIRAIGMAEDDSVFGSLPTSRRRSGRGCFPGGTPSCSRRCAA